MVPRRTFGNTWWGAAWVDALEHRAQLDPNRLPRGRTYARQDRVDRLEVEPGAVRAFVHGSRSVPYRVRLGVRPFTDDEWELALDAIAARAGHAAALLDGELDPGIVEDTQAAGVDLLPQAGELRPDCSCPDWANPCKHAAAVCYLTADLLDDDPFTLFLLRGRTRDEVLAEVRRRRSGTTGTTGSDGADRAGAGTAPDIDPGVAARDAWAWTPADPPRPPTPRSAPGRPAPWATDPPAGAPFTADGLRELAADAAERAWDMTRGDGRADLTLDPDADLARRASGALGTDRWAALLAATGESDRALRHLATAWRFGGEAALAAIGDPPWRADPLVMGAARDAVGAALKRYGAVAVRENRLTIPAIDVPLRLGRDGRWWRFEKRAGRWELAAPPAMDPDDLILSAL